MMGGAHIDKEAAERGRKIFVPTCGFCHGNDARGKSGPDLVRSAFVLHDNEGDVIGPLSEMGGWTEGCRVSRCFLRSRLPIFPPFYIREQQTFQIGLLTGSAI